MQSHTKTIFFLLKIVHAIALEITHSRVYCVLRHTSIEMAYFHTKSTAHS